MQEQTSMAIFLAKFNVDNLSDRNIMLFRCFSGEFKPAKHIGYIQKEMKALLQWRLQAQQLRALGAEFILLRQAFKLKQLTGITGLRSVSRHPGVCQAQTPTGSRAADAYMKVEFTAWTSTDASGCKVVTATQALCSLLLKALTRMWDLHFRSVQDRKLAGFKWKVLISERSTQTTRTRMGCCSPRICCK